MKRKTVGKGLRFDIFTRDGFTCQYCGTQPPQATLQIDHITPVAKGGNNDKMNLITSCQGCNLGKGKKSLDKPQRPDADLAWLEMQQELAELKSYQKAKTERDKVLEEIIESLCYTWLDNSGLSWHPTDQVLRKMLLRYSPEVVEESLVNVAHKVAGGYIKRNEWHRYCWGVLKHKHEGT